MDYRKRVHILVSGRVQGVLFRQAALNKARALKLTGFVTNLLDGGVEILAEGDKDKLEALVGFAEKGPLAAKVDNCKITWEKYQD